MLVLQGYSFTYVILYVVNCGLPRKPLCFPNAGLPINLKGRQSGVLNCQSGVTVKVMVEGSSSEVRCLRLCSPLTSWMALGELIIIFVAQFLNLQIAIEEN